MLISKKRLVLLLCGFVIGVQLLAACSSTPEEAVKVEPVIVEKVDGSEFNHLTLTERAVERLDIQSEAVREAEVDGSVKLLIPYSAVIYGVNGETWTYVRNPGSDSRTFVRELIAIERIDGGLAVLSAGPPPGTQVVTVGVAELFGADTGVGK